MIGIYKITSPSSKVYIGQSSNIKKRFQAYKYRNCKGQTKLYSSFVKHGYESHLFEVIEECSKNIINERERYWQEFYNCNGVNGLNCMLVKTSYVNGGHSQETKNKMSASKIGHISKLKGKKIGKRPHNYTEYNHGAGVLNTITGIYYTSISDAAKSCNMKQISLYCIIKERNRKNKTDFILI